MTFGISWYIQSCLFFQARVNAEVQAATLQRQRAIEEKKMKEMEKIREQLEKLLEEERQAKKYEEIVRTLQVTPHRHPLMPSWASSMAILHFARQKIVPNACQSN